jgi:hypothetical protein
MSFCAWLPERLDTVPRTDSDRAATKNVSGKCQAAGMPRCSDFDRIAQTAILSRQHQVITRSQILASGMTESALVHRLRAGGPWQRLLPGVFLAVTGAPASDQRDLAALLYAGPGSLLTGTAALRLWGVRAPYSSLTDVLIPDSKQRWPIPASIPRSPFAPSLRPPCHPDRRLTPPRSAPYPASIGALPRHNGASPRPVRSETPGSSR